MDLLTLLAILSGSAALLTLLWISLRAFRKHPGWGLLVLLLSPLGASIYGITHWREEKTPFLSYITTFSVSLAVSLYLFTSWGGWEMVRAGHRYHQGVQAQNPNQEDAMQYMRTSMNFIENSGLDQVSQQHLESVQMQLARFEEPQQETVAETEAGATGAVVPGESGVQPAAQEITRATISKKVDVQDRYHLEYMTIDAGDAGNYVGYTVKVTRRGVPEREYRLTGMRGNRLYFAQRNGGGSYSFSYNIRDIDKIRVLTKHAD